MKQKTFTRLLALVIVALLTVTMLPTALAEDSSQAAPNIKSATYNAADGSLSMVATTSDTEANILETYILVDKEISDAIGNFTINGVLYNIMGIMTNELSQDNVSVGSTGDGQLKVGLNNSQQYFGNNTPPGEGDTIYVAAQTESNGKLSEVSTPQAMTIQNGVATVQDNSGQQTPSNTTSQTVVTKEDSSSTSKEPVTPVKTEDSVKQYGACQHSQWARIPTYVGDLGKHRIICAKCGAAWTWEAHHWHATMDDQDVIHFTCVCGANTAKMSPDQGKELEETLKGFGKGVGFPDEWLDRYGEEGLQEMQFELRDELKRLEDQQLLHALEEGNADVNQPAEQQTTEQQPAEQQTTEQQQPAEQQTTEQQPAEQKPTETVTEQPAEQPEETDPIKAWEQDQARRQKEEEEGKIEMSCEQRCDAECNGSSSPYAEKYAKWLAQQK